MANRDRERPEAGSPAPQDEPAPVEQRQPATTAAEEWGSRHDQGRAIAGGGKEHENVPGAQADSGPAS